MTQTRSKPLRYTKAIIAQKTAQRAVWVGRFGEETEWDGEATVLYVTKIHQLYPKLYQEDPKEKSTYKPPNGQGHRSFTNSYESYKNKATVEAGILEANDRLPTKEIIWKLLTVLTQKEIIEIRNYVFNYLKRHRLNAVVAIELTYGKNGMPNNTVHLHILTDDLRSEEELKNLLKTPCKRKGLIENKDFQIHCRTLPNPETYFDYFTKRNRTDKEWCKRNNKKRVLLFQKPENGRAIQKFYEIGTWFMMPKPVLWEKWKEKKYGKKYCKKSK
jgi:hypothetical protein